jgi:UDP-glucose 4-epimerase
VFGTDYGTPDGTCVRDFVHVRDIARAHLLALDRLDDLGLEFFNIGSETGYSVLELISAVEEVVGVPVPWRPAVRRRGDPEVLVASARRVRECLDWAPEVPGLRPIITSAFLWRTAHPRGYATA